MVNNNGNPSIFSIENEIREKTSLRDREEKEINKLAKYFLYNSLDIHNNATMEKRF